MKENLYNESFASVYDLIIPSETAHDMARFIDSLLTEDSVILELGVGTGRAAHAIAELGNHVIGVDTSEAMLAKARLKEPPHHGSISYLQADMSKLPSQLSADLILCVAGSLCCLQNQEDRIATFTQARGVIEAGGLFILEVYNPDFVVAWAGSGGAEKIVSSEYPQYNAVLHSRYSFDPGDLCWRVEHSWRSPNCDTRFQEKVKLLRAPELAAEAAKAGWALKEVYGDWHGSELVEGQSPMLILTFVAE